VEDADHLQLLDDGCQSSQLVHTEVDRELEEGGWRDEDLVGVVFEILVREEQNRDRQRRSCTIRSAKVQDSRMESLAVGSVGLKADHALQRAECLEDTSSGEDGHPDPRPYCACQGRQHELEQMPGLGTKLG